MTEADARAIAAPGSREWPMSGEAANWVKFATLEHNAFLQRTLKRAHEQQFNRAEHDRFMRGLG